MSKEYNRLILLKNAAGGRRADGVGDHILGDMVNCLRCDGDIPPRKPFGYTYQREYRFCWVPTPPVAKLEHKDIKIGSLSDIAELIVI